MEEISNCQKVNRAKEVFNSEVGNTSENRAEPEDDKNIKGLNSEVSGELDKILALCATVSNDLSDILRLDDIPKATTISQASGNLIDSITNSTINTFCAHDEDQIGNAAGKVSNVLLQEHDKLNNDELEADMIADCSRVFRKFSSLIRKVSANGDNITSPVSDHSTDASTSSSINMSFSDLVNVPKSSPLSSQSKINNGL